MYHFDIPKSRQYDTGKIEVIARNSAGEAITSTELQVVSRRDDYRAVLKNSPRRKFLPDTDLECFKDENIKQTNLNERSEPNVDIDCEANTTDTKLEFSVAFNTKHFTKQASFDEINSSNSFHATQISIPYLDFPFLLLQI